MPARAADLNSLLPDDTNFIVSVNVKQILQTPLFARNKKQVEDLLKLDSVQMVLKDTGFDPQKAWLLERRQAEARMRLHPPDYVVTGFTGSPELKDLIRDRYELIAEGPNNMTANYNNCSQLFRRKDLASP